MGRRTLKGWVARRLFSERTIEAIRHDLRRFRLRLRRRRARDIVPPHPRLHLASGRFPLDGWHNVDMARSDYDMDLAALPFPWGDDAFDVVLTQHFIEHLDLFGELTPMLTELRRVLRSGGELWLSTPDIAKICNAYIDGTLGTLLERRAEFYPQYDLKGRPISQLVNDLFHQRGEHMNLFDFDMLEWMLADAGFIDIRETTQAELRERLPEVPARVDELETIYVFARNP